MNGKEKQRLRRGRKAETMLRARTRTEKDVFSKCRRNIFIPFLRQASQQLFSKENKFPFKKEIIAVFFPF